MALPATADTVKVALGWTAPDGQQCENIFYVKDDSGVIVADPVSYANAVAGTLAATLATDLYSNVSFNQVGVEDVGRVPFGGVVVPITPIPGSKASSTKPIPNSCALAIKKVTVALGRNGRGRWYWPITDQAALSDANTVDTTYAGNIVSALGAFHTAVEALVSGSEVGFVSYFTGGAVRGAGVFQRVVSYGVTDHTIDNQRRRLPGRGR